MCMFCLCLSIFSLAYTCAVLSLWVQYPTEEDMIEWAKRESEREEKERLARLTQQEQEDLELAIALSKSELSWGNTPYPRALLLFTGPGQHGTAQPGPEQKAPKQSGDCTHSAADPMKRLYRNKPFSECFNTPFLHDCFRSPLASQYWYFILFVTGFIGRRRRRWCVCCKDGHAVNMDLRIVNNYDYHASFCFFCFFLSMDCFITTSECIYLNM